MHAHAPPAESPNEGRQGNAASLGPSTPVLTSPHPEYPRVLSTPGLSPVSGSESGGPGGPLLLFSSHFRQMNSETDLVASTQRCHLLISSATCS